MVAKQGVCIPTSSDRGECGFGHGGVLWENPISQIKFRKSLVNAFIPNEYFNEQNDVTPEKKTKKQ